MDHGTFHAGELTLQQHSGAAQRLAQAGPRVIRDHMPLQHREFFGQLPLLLAGMVDGDGQPWASVLAGPPGFVHSPHERALRINAQPLPEDPLQALLRDGAPIGLLGIEAHTRRRNRLNGWITGVDEGGFGIRVGQSFGNCPKYIHAREARYAESRSVIAPLERCDGLDDPARQSIAAADTFFIATSHPQASGQAQPAWGVDVSHRGGKPGFIQVDGDRLTVPDFAGNSFFNTLGNLVLEPRCGLLFIDYAGGGLTWLAARAELVLEGPALRAFAGAQRLMRLHVERLQRLPGALPLRWGPGSPAPEVEFART